MSTHRPLLPPERINALATQPRHCSRMEPAPVIDTGRPWVPEHYTPLYFSPVYASFNDAQRLRYNQLSALRVNEYIMMLEGDLVPRLLPALLRYPAVRAQPALGEALRTMLLEECRHYAGFAALNRQCRPDLYPAGQNSFFARLPAASRMMLGLTGLLCARHAFALWYLMAMEESSKSLARLMVAQPLTETLGPLDAGFASVHLQHLKDEARHLHIDQHLMACCLPSQRARCNAWLFGRMLARVLHVSRNGSGVRVVRQLVRDCPELLPRQPNLIAAMLALKHNPRFQHSLFNRRIMPDTFRIFDQTPALAHLGNILPGYDRPENTPTAQGTAST